MAGKRRPMDLCRACHRYALGCEPLVMPDGQRLRQLQRDGSKRYCHYHMPSLNESRRAHSKRRMAGLPPLPKHVPPPIVLPQKPLVFETFSNFIHYTTPCINKESTPAFYVESLGRVLFHGSKVRDIEWFAKPQAFLREGDLYFVCGIRALSSDGTKLRAIKYRRSRECDPLWLWRQDGRDEVFERYAARMPHVNAVVWQWGLAEKFLSSERSEVA